MHRRRGPILLRAGIVLVWLLIGAAVNVGVAWGQAVLYQREEFGYATSDRLSYAIESPTQTLPASEWPVGVPAEWTVRPVRQTRWAEPWRVRRVHVFSEWTAWPRGSVSVMCYGVPFDSLSEWARLLTGSRDMILEHGEGGRLALERIGWRPEYADSVPIRPLWPGFALNTLFYAALAWGLWQIPLALRRQRRRRAGRCVRCGYDRTGIADDTACPECGAEGVSA